MKNFFLKKSLKMVKDFYPEYDDDKLDEVRYGLEATYLSITKTIVILFISFLLGIFKESIIYLLLFNGLRATGFGLHASKSWMCWVSSSITFLLIPYLCIELVIPQYLLIILSILCITNFLLYAPADTVKRPLVRKKKRIIYKVLTVLISLIYVSIIFTTENTFIQNALIFAMLLEGVLINPITYKIFKSSYRNYEKYVFSTSV